jgi:transcriptional regulator with XRE-family HTH domain
MNTKNKKKFSIKDLENIVGNRTISSFLCSWRKGQNMSQSDFAKLLGISRANLCDIERNRKGVSPERAAKFAKTLGYSVNILVEMALEEQLAAMGFKFKVTLGPAA